MLGVSILLEEKRHEEKRIRYDNQNCRRLLRTRKVREKGLARSNLIKPVEPLKTRAELVLRNIHVLVPEQNNNTSC